LGAACTFARCPNGRPISRLLKATSSFLLAKQEQTKRPNREPSSLLQEKSGLALLLAWFALLKNEGFGRIGLFLLLRSRSRVWLRVSTRLRESRGEGIASVSNLCASLVSAGLCWWQANSLLSVSLQKAHWRSRETGQTNRRGSGPRIPLCSLLQRR
jgi:hypothetical protein